MEERIRHRLEDYLGGKLAPGADPLFDRLVESRPENLALLNSYRENAELFRETLRAPEGVAPAPGFYARVLARVEMEASQPSFWSTFTGVFGQRLVYASVMLLLILGIALVGTEADNRLPEYAEAPARILVDDRPDVHLVGNEDEDRGRVFVNLASFEDYQ